ncbi:hypothetical protein EV401DRAFT_691959 [Pisolithus croceorrhizus]|nr:hypothetical protein EV401DRAFT_691959 [Pisolithus croceorrhizus]
MMWPGMVRSDANSPNTQMQPSCLKSETGFLHHPIDTPGQVRSSAYPTLESTSFHYTSYSGDMGFPGEFLPFILIGGLISAGLYGVTTLQGLMCISCTTPKTPLPKKILDTIHVSFTCHVLYYYLIINYGVSTSLGYSVWTLSASPVPNACMISAVQLFFAHAIHSLCRPQVRWFLLRRSSTCRSSNFSGLGFTPRHLPRSPPHLLRTKRLLNTLIIYAVNRCLLNLLATIAELATVIEVQTAWSTGLSLITGSLYANSFLASLNSRKRLRPQNSSTESLAGEHVSTIHFVNLPRLSGDEHRPQDEVRRFDMHERDETV